MLGVAFCLVLSLGVFGQSTNRQLAEDFTAITLAGQSVNLQQHRGKIVVLTFWSTRCAICASEIPKLNKIADKYAGKDVVFYGLSVENETNITSYLKRKPFRFTVIPDSLGVVLKYARKDSGGRITMGFPAIFVINQDGRIVLNASGYDKTGALDSQISSLLISKEAEPVDNKKGGTPRCCN